MISFNPLLSVVNTPISSTADIYAKLFIPSIVDYIYNNKVDLPTPGAPPSSITNYLLILHQELY